MAEIKIKKKQSILPWILLILGILALVYYLFTRNGDVVDDTMDDDIEMMTDDSGVSNDMENNDALMLSDRANSKISEYRTYIADSTKMGLDHEYSNEALTKLIDATESVANSLDVDIDADLENARSNAQEITQDPTKVDHADKIKNAGEIIVQALKKIQERKFPDEEQGINELQNAIGAITPATKTLDQKDKIKSFFEQSGQVLTNMKNN